MKAAWASEKQYDLNWIVAPSFPAYPWFSCAESTPGISLLLSSQLFSVLRQNQVLFQLLRCWNSLSREAVDASSVESFKANLSGARHSLTEWFATQPSAEGLELQGLCLLLPKTFCSSMMWLLFIPEMIMRNDQTLFLT